MRRLLAAFLLFGAVLSAQAIRTNPGFSAKSVARNDDGSAPIEPLGFTINFFGKQRSQGYVNNNGNITFDSSLATFTPFGLDSTGREIIAPFFADVDTRSPSSALVTYGRDTVNGHAAFGANFLNVGYFNSHADKLNSFQVVLIDRSDVAPGDFDMEFNYQRITWETGDASGGAGGIGGVPAAVGWSNGTRAAGTSFQLDGSLISGSFLDGSGRALVRQRLNSPVIGRLLFRARDGQIQAPVAISTGCPLPPASLNAPYAGQFSFTGGGATNPRWSAQPDPGGSFPAGLTLSPGGLLSGVPTAVGTTDFTVSLTVKTEDGDQTLVERCSLSVTPPNVILTSGCTLPPAKTGVSYRQSLQASGGRGPYTWSVTGNGGQLNIPGLSLTNDGVLSGTPVQDGSYIFNVQVNSNPADQAQPATSACTLTVQPSVLNISAGCNVPSATVGVPYSQNLQISGGTAPYTWTSSVTLPAGLSLTPGGRLFGVPVETAVTPFTATVTDSRGQVVTERCSLTVTNPRISITSGCPLPRGTTGRTYMQRVLAAGGTAPYSFSVLGSLPVGLTLSSDGLISGTPVETGPNLFRLLATDSTGSAAGSSCSLSVLPSAFYLTSCPLQNASVGVPYNQVLGVAGSPGSYVFTNGASLPAGLSIDSFGRVSGTPTTAGTYQFQVQVQDSQGQTTRQPCAVTVDGSPVQLSGSCPLTSATLGVPYNAGFTASGGTGPYTFSLEGSLPPGLALRPNGIVQGAPTGVTSTAFTVRATDARGIFTRTDCSLAVTMPPVPALSIGAVPPSFSPASTGPTIVLQLARPYSLSIRGQLNLSVAGNTGQGDPTVNQPDPLLRFNGGVTSVPFTIPAGTRQLTFPIASTGTVASTVTVSVSNLKAGGQDITVVPAARTFTVSQTVPIITGGCFTSTPTDSSATVTGYTSTRSLTTAVFALTPGSGGGSQTLTVDVTGSSLGFFAADASVRNGGAFTLTIPLTTQGASIGSAAVTLSNSVGPSAQKTLTKCQ